MKAPCGLEDCDCGHTIEKLETVGAKLVAILEGFHPRARPSHWVRAINAFKSATKKEKP